MRALPCNLARAALGLTALCASVVSLSSAEPSGVTFSVSFPSARSSQPLDGRVLLLLSTNPAAEPRFQITDGIDTQLVFGTDVDNLAPGRAALIDNSAFGYPIRALSQLKPGDYYVQAVLHRYETFHRADGFTVKLPMDRGEGQQWNRAPGNLYSKPRKIHLDPAQSQRISLSLDQEIPPIPEPKDTKYVRHIKIKSELLSKFWGRPIYLGAHVLVPEGFDDHPAARFPLMVFEGHFPSDISGFRTEPPDPNLKPDYSERFHLNGYNRIEQEEAYKFYKQWISPGFPRYLVIEIQHANQYYDDSYAVNSANLGPYGDAINRELIPYIEKKFRGIGQGWARFLYGGSTGGWESLATQMFYPDDYNGTFAACPDPIDFQAFTVVNIYKDRNEYFDQGPHNKIDRPWMRNYLGQILATMKDANYHELALGTHSRSGGQADIWEAVYGPVGPDGYPKPLYDKATGQIDPAVAQYWRDHYDLGHILERDWPKLGAKLQGKIHINCGSADSYYLNDAVYLVEDILKSEANPPADAEVAYGPRAEHCWNGDPKLPNYLSRLHYNTMYLPKSLARIKASAPPGADLTSWRY